MKGKDLIKIIKENNLKNFKTTASFTDGYNVFPNVKTINLKGLSNIGVSAQTAQTVYLEGELSELYDTDMKEILTGDKLIDLIQSNELEEFLVEVSFETGEYKNRLPIFNTVKLIELGDIAHSDNMFLLDAEL